MTSLNLDKVCNPRSVSVIGASETPGSLGGAVVKRLVDAGFSGEIFPVNPHHLNVFGYQAYSKMCELPRSPDLAVIATPAATVPALVQECGEAKVGGVLILSAGFGEAGAQGVRLEDELRKTLMQFPEMRVIGPNCLGVVVPAAGLNASFASAPARAGRIAFISQSGALAAAVLDWSSTAGIGFSHFISIGNAIDVTIGDLIDYLAEDSNTDSIVLYVESIRDARGFMSAARAFTRTKPIVVYKAGRSAASAVAVASHTGGLAGVDAVYDAAFRRAGIVRVHHAEEIFDCAELLARHRLPQGNRLGIVTNAGGPGIMAMDALTEVQCEPAHLSEVSCKQLSAALPSVRSNNTPIDVLGDAGPADVEAALKIVIVDAGVDAALVILTPQAVTDPLETAKRVAAIAHETPKPILAVWMGGETMKAGIAVLERAGVATFEVPGRAVRAFGYLNSYRRNRETLYETPHFVDLQPKMRLDLAQAQLADALSGNHFTLNDIESKRLLSHFGIGSTQPQLASSAWGAILLARNAGYPVAMKVQSPQLVHKTEVHGVALGLANDHDVQTSFDELMKRTARLRPDAEIQGVTIEPMLSLANSVELLLGAKKDPIFGSVLLVGAGGVTAAIANDHAIELPPLNDRLAHRLIDSLHIRPLLYGFRGRPVLAIDRLIETVLRFSFLVSENPTIAEIEINPLVVGIDSVTALDARVVLERTCLSGARRYSHLAIRPYPDEFVRLVSLNDGTRVRLRPIRPEDEPMWHCCLKSCTEDTLWHRFWGLFKETTHEMATRFCFSDYDRSLPILAELVTDNDCGIIGVGRLEISVDHQDAEFALLVADKWQGRGLGNVLTRFCFEICDSWGIEHVHADTTTDNLRMRSILDHHHFHLSSSAGNEEHYVCDVKTRKCSSRTTGLQPVAAN
jgi:acetyltransferase